MRSIGRPRAPDSIPDLSWAPAMSGSLCVLISAAGRRPYLLRWFREALQMNGIDGTVILADADRHAGGQRLADEFVHAPTVVDDGYSTWLDQTLASYNVDLAISVNDFELSAWSTHETDSPALVRLTPDRQSLAEDKAALADELASLGVTSPPTWLGSQIVDDPKVLEETDEFVVKSRYGSGSVGLAMCSRSELLPAVHQAAGQVYGRDGQPLAGTQGALDAVIVQQRVHGIEYGLDVVSDLEGQYRETFAREKLTMRFGETEKAMTVDGSPFRDHGRAISALLGHRGPIDVDVLVDAEARAWVIDVNPRFGGGYPLTHVAGAHLPAAMVAWAAGGTPDESWLTYTVNAVSAKVVDVVRAT